jgi:oxygen-dependent protoporphyrinogen oxidase
MRIAVVGGGITGLAAAYQLSKEEGLEVCLIEKENRVGGVIISEFVNGFLIEGGPDCLYTEKPWALELVKELGLSSELVFPLRENRGTYIFWDKKLRKLPEGLLLVVPTNIWSFIWSDLLSPWGKIRALLEVLIPPLGEEESVKEFISRRFGKEIYERIAEPLIGGIHGGDAEKLSLERVLPRFKELENNYGSVLRGLRRILPKRRNGLPFVSFKQGMEELVRGLKGAIKDNIKTVLGKKLIDIEPLNKGFKLILNGEEIEVEGLILAIPSYEAEKIVRGLFPSLKELLLKIPHSSSLVISLAFNKGDIEEINGHGFLIPKKERFKISAVSFSSRKFPFRAPENKILLRLFLKGDELFELDDEKIFSLSLEELSRIIKIKSNPIFWRLYRWPKRMAQMVVGHRRLVEEIRREISSLKGLLIAGSSYDGIGIGDCVRSGRETARFLLRQLKNEGGD